MVVEVICIVTNMRKDAQAAKTHKSCAFCSYGIGPRSHIVTTRKPDAVKVALNDVLFVKPALAIGRFFWKSGDGKTIVGFLNGVAMGIVLSQHIWSKDTEYI